jgi:hypothetical protein
MLTIGLNASFSYKYDTVGRRAYKKSGSLYKKLRAFMLNLQQALHYLIPKRNRADSTIIRDG